MAENVKKKYDGVIKTLSDLIRATLYKQVNLVPLDNF